MNFLKSKKTWLITLGVLLSLGTIGGVVGGLWNQIHNKPVSLSSKTSDAGNFSYANALKMTKALSATNTQEISDNTKEDGSSDNKITKYTGDPIDVQDSSLVLGKAEFTLTTEETTKFKVILKVDTFSDNDNDLFKNGWIPVSQNVWRLRKSIINPVVAAMFNNNKSRFLSITDYQWDRSPLEVKNLEFKGWTKTMGSVVEMLISDNEKVPAQNISYTKDNVTHKGLVVQIGNKVKTLELVNKHLEKNPNIKILILENITIDNDELKNQIDLLPNSIEKLTLFWNTDTAHALRNLYQKDNIKELELNSTILKSINPYAIPKNAFVPRDYGISAVIETFDFSGDNQLTADAWIQQMNFAKSKEASLRIFQGYFGGSGGYVAKLNLKNTQVTESDLNKLKTLDPKRGYRWIIFDTKTIEYFNVEFPKEMEKITN